MEETVVAADSQSQGSCDSVAGDNKFKYRFTSDGSTYQLIVPVLLPISAEQVGELAVRLIRCHNLPCYLEKELSTKLWDWARQQTLSGGDEAADSLLEQSMNNEKVLHKCIGRWVRRYVENHAQFSILQNTVDDQFPDVYQSLILSPAVTSVLQLEHTYTVSMGNLITRRNEAVQNMETRHEAELHSAMEREGYTLTDRDINTLTRQHVMEKEEMEVKWSSEVSMLEDTQRRDYKDWLTRLHDEMSNTTSGPGIEKQSVRSALATLTSAVVPESNGDTLTNTQPDLEESFTINLGSQKKTSHNLRLMCGNVFDLCRNTARGGRSFTLDPQQLQTAMSLYTSEVCALIMMEEAGSGTINSTRETFAQVCRQSTDLHFSSIDKQLSLLNQYALAAREHRKLSSTPLSSTTTPVHSRHASPYHSRENISMGSPSDQSNVASGGQDDTLLHPHWSSGGGNSSPAGAGQPVEDESLSLEAGDFYITHHSNLSQLHLVFHLITDRKVVLSPSLSARHQIMQGLKTCLRTAAQHGIHNVIIPLLLVHNMEPEMTISWCLKRAELVFKSVKGFMLENTAWRENETWTVQFLIPVGTSRDLFDQITDLLPKTFRIAATRDLSTTTLR